MLNIESALVAFYKERGYRALTEVPDPRPEQFVSIERTGGASDSVVVDRPTIAVQCWAKTREDAARLAYEIDALIDELQTIPNITYAQRNALYNFPDLKGQHARYQIILDLVTR